MIWEANKVTANLCARCKQGIDNRAILGPNQAWCGNCHDVVQLSSFQVQGWVMGVVVILAAHAHLVQLV